MNLYLERFLTLGLDKHLKILYEFFFGFNGSIIMYYIFLFIYIIAGLALPWVIVKIISEYDEKHPKYAIFIDIISIIVFALVSMTVINFYSGIRTGLSSTGAFYGSSFRGLVHYRENIGRLCGVVYSILINSRLLGKYLVKFRIDKYKKPIFWALFVVWLLIYYYFYYLCRFL